MRTVSSMGTGNRYLVFGISGILGVPWYTFASRWSRTGKPSFRVSVAYRHPRRSEKRQEPRSPQQRQSNSATAMKSFKA